MTLRIYCDGATIDVEAEYSKRGFSTLPPTPTMRAADIRHLAGRPASYTVWHGIHPLKDEEAVPVVDGMKFDCVPNAHH